MAGSLYGYQFTSDFLVAFPYDFISVLGLLVLVNYIRYRSILKRYKGPSGVKNMFDSISSGMDSSTEMSLRYLCMSCGKEHKEISCPNCGSKMKKIGGEVFAQIYYKKVTSPPCFIHETDREKH